MSGTGILTRPDERTDQRTDQPWLWNVVLLDDQDHTYEYVIDMLQRLFGHPLEKAFQVARNIDEDGRGVCMTIHRELAELKVEQIHSYGADCLIASSAGPMSAIIEPAQYGSDDDRDPSGD